MDGGVFLSRAQTMLEQGAYEGALEAARQCLDGSPGNIDALMILCHACMRLGKLDEASAVIENVEKMVMGLSRIYACMGDICFKGGLNQEAVKFYRRFVALNPGSDLSREILGKLRLVEGDIKDLVPDKDDRAAPAQPVTAGFQTMTMVDLYLRQGHLDGAEALLEQMLAREPENAAVQKKLAEVQALTGAEAVKAVNLRQREKVIGKLNRWLELIERRRLYAIQ